MDIESAASFPRVSALPSRVGDARGPAAWQTRAVRRPVLTPPGTGLGVRRASFEEVPSLLALVQGAIERGCAAAYGPAQRRAVLLSYATSLFVDVLGPYETLVAERAGALVGLAQLDAARARLRALFVAAEAQGGGIGRALLEAVEGRAARAGLGVLRGAMSLNAVPFYTRAGFVALAGPQPSFPAGPAGPSVPIVPMEKRLPRGLLEGLTA
jgi:GNAT superfamily N-acetyltransferase